ncbi:MAG TPA: GDP-mannose 4,6-dehydratase [Longimicrobiaceae bacterium]|nr:GDP-mannose 4,6-dehydratase [Longimicrobiaceae bacterium]
MRTLVTGAGGFVGQHLLRELLAAGYSVFGGTQDGAPVAGGTLSRAEVEGVRWVALDVTSTESLAAAVADAEPDHVYHLAGQSSVARSFSQPMETWDVNATGTLRLTSALADAGLRDTRVLLASSAEVYGRVPEAEQPIREDRPLNPASPYAASKAAAEMVARQASASAGPAVVIARSFVHTGPGQDGRFAIPSFAHQLAGVRAGRNEPTLRVGNLSVRRDVLDVRDVVRAYRCLVERGAPGEVYNVCSGEAHELRGLVEEMIELSGTGARIETDPERFRPVDLPLLVGDGGRLRALGWKPEIPLRETLSDLLADAERT